MRRTLPLLIATILAVQAAPAHAASGDLDPTFGGGDGVASARFSIDVSARTAELAPDGRVVVAGTALGRMALARFLPDGSLDPTFGRDGKVKVPFGALNDIAILPDGSIVGVGGNFLGWLVCRFTAGGELDPAFGTGGCGEPAFDGEAYGVEVDATGRVIVVGEQESTDAAVARYRRGGTLDPSFSGDGRRLLTIDTAEAGAPYEWLFGAASTADGGLVVAGLASGDAVGIVRLDADGALVPTFGDGGRVVLGVGSFAFAYASSVLVEGARIVIALQVTDAMGVLVLDADGAPDPSFGGGDGLQLIDAGRTNVLGTSLAPFPSGGYVVAGAAGQESGGIDVVVARLDESGEPVSSFGDAGLVTIERAKNDFAEGVGVRPDGRIVVGGGMEGELRPDGTKRTKFLVFQLLG